MNSRHLDFCTIVEQEYLLTGTFPSYDRVNELMHCTRAWYTACIEDTELLELLSQRGLPVEQLLGLRSLGALTAEQLMCVNKLLDFNDTRSDKKKLDAIGVSSTKYAAWKKDPGFQEYMRQRAENLFGDNLDEVHRALLDNARSGDISSIKLIYQLTGRFDPNAAGQIDAKAIITQVLESIMRHVKDPDIIRAIASDFQLIATSQGLNAPKIIEGAATRAIPA